jgi:hypothetical protein
MTSTKTHHNLKIKSEIGLKKIWDIQMSIKKNEHGRLEVVGIPDKEIQEYLNTPLIDKDFILLTKDEQDKEEIVFSGIIEKIEQQKEKGIDKVKLQVVTKSIILDRQEKSRSFQNINQTYEEIAKEILKEYSGAVIATVGEKVPIGKPLIQYKETDWEFIKRITSHFESIIYPEYKQAKLKDQELKYIYKYGAKGNQKTPIVYNEQIVGMTLLGEVEKTDKEEVNIKLRINKGKKGLYLPDGVKFFL